MKFERYLTILNNLAKNNPETLGFDVVYSIDDESNEYKEVNMDPGSVGHKDAYGNVRFTDQSGEILNVPQCNTVVVN